MTASLARLVAAADAVAATSGRNDKVDAIARVLSAMIPEEVGLAAAYLAGDPPQDRMEVGWATVHGLSVPPAATPTLSLRDVDSALTALAEAGGPGSRGHRQQVLTDLFGAATDVEQQFLSRLILGEMRQGALTGVVLKGVAAAASMPETVVRRALMLAADLGEVTRLALTGGRAALEQVGLRVGRGVQPMLASTAASVTDAVQEMGQAVVEWKLDGMRVQVHKDGEAVTVYTRNLNDITDRSPQVVAVTRALDATSVILDGELLGLGADDRPVPFQQTMSEVTNTVAGGGAVPFFFDLLHHDGEDLIDVPLTGRRQRLEAIVPAVHLIPSAVVQDGDAGEAVLADALDRGHEGVMVKSLDGTYAAGRRGKAWRKVKPVQTLDLVVLAVEWGSGRRQGLLSNIHLGARDDRPGHDGFVMLGKTFKGMTDETLAWQTQRFLDLQTHREGHVVHVRPEQVVEIALDGVQTSRRYPGGVALRFARVLRYRDDKTPAQADRLSDVRRLGPDR